MAEDWATAWEQVAPAWERHRNYVFEQTRPVSDWLVERIEAKPGETVLEIGAGPGETGFEVAERIEPDGRLISTDVAPSMVEAARRGAQTRGLTNVEFRTLDAQAIDLPNVSVDAIISRFALMLIPDLDSALRGIRRVLRPGGRFAFATWGPPERNMWVAPIGLAMLAAGLMPPADPTAPGGVFSLATAEKVAGPLRAAGLELVETAEIEAEITSPSFDEYWGTQTQLAGPLAVILREQPPEVIEKVKATGRQVADQFRDGERYRIPAVALGVLARPA